MLYTPEAYLPNHDLPDLGGHLLSKLVGSACMALIRR
jgi:hypothetical protein